MFRFHVQSQSDNRLYMSWIIGYQMPNSTTVVYSNRVSIFEDINLPDKITGVSVYFYGDLGFIAGLNWIPAMSSLTNTLFNIRIALTDDIILNTNLKWSTAWIDTYIPDPMQAGPQQAIANFSITKLVPFKFKFTNSSTGTYSSWDWDFGDGTTSTAASPEHIYTVAKTYQVRLRIYAESLLVSTKTVSLTVEGTGEPGPIKEKEAGFNWLIAAIPAGIGALILLIMKGKKK